MVIVDVPHVYALPAMPSTLCTLTLSDIVFLKEYYLNRLEKKSADLVTIILINFLILVQQSKTLRF